MEKSVLRTALAGDPADIRQQLERLLTSSQFRNSKRSQALLKYVVEEAAEGHYDRLKERTIGVQVFGREPTYDSNQDAIVRNAAVEVRKRLAQYYMEPAHENDLRIDLPPGAYAPEFLPHPHSIAEPEAAAAAQLVSTDSIAEAPAPRRRLRLMALAAVALLACVSAGFGISHILPSSPDAELNKFWAPLLEGREPVQICVGQPRRVFRFTGPRRAELERHLLDPASAAAPAPISPAEVNRAGPDMLYYRDAYAMALMTGLLQSHNKAYRLRNDGTAPFAELRRSPLIAIGAFNNLWTMRLTSGLRYSFEHETIDGVSYNYIRDHQNPSSRAWRTKTMPSFSLMDEDYLIVTRVMASATERTVISVAGFSDYGTLAAGEFATDPAHLSKALRNGPKGWEKNNIQVVLHTKVIEGSQGPPAVVAMHFW